MCVYNVACRLLSTKISWGIFVRGGLQLTRERRARPWVAQALSSWQGIIEALSWAWPDCHIPQVTSAAADIPASERTACRLQPSGPLQGTDGTFKLSSLR